MDFQRVTDLVLGHRPRSSLIGAVACDSIESIDGAHAKFTIGLGYGWSGRNTSAAFVSAAGDETWFGLFIGQDDDERSIFASAAAALACDEAVHTTPATDRSLRQLVEVAHRAVILIQNERVPAALELGSNQTGVANRLAGIAVSGCLGRLSVSGFELVRLGACSLLDGETGRPLIDADLLEGEPNRFRASYKTGLGLHEPRYRQTEALVAPAQTSLCACSLWLQEALFTEAGRSAFEAAKLSGDWAPLEPALAATSGTSSRAFLAVDTPQSVALKTPRRR